MKNLSLIIVFLLFAVFTFSDSKITRGPNVGEIYFIGPTHTGTGLYYSTDFGETAVCVDSVSTLSNTIEAITADKTLGCLYFVTMGEALYYSGNYGQFGSWQLKSGGVSYRISSGRNEGGIYANFYSHSEDFGSTFNYHTCNGYFGSSKSFSIDSFDENIGYIAASKSNIPDSIYIFLQMTILKTLRLERFLTSQMDILFL